MKLFGLFLIIVVFFFEVQQSICEESFQFNTDYAVFKGNDNKALLEIYYSFYMGSLSYSFVNGEFIATVFIDIKISRKNDNSVVMSQQYSTNSVVKDTSGIELKKNLIGQLNFTMPSGEYSMEITGTDSKNNLFSDTQKYLVSIPENLNEIKLSGVELASDIRKSSDVNNSFYKNTLSVIPNPASIFGNNLKMVYFYAELYNLNTDSSYVIQKKIFDLNKNLLFTSDKSIKPGNSSIAEFGTIGIDTLKSGIYFLEIALVSNLNSTISSQEKKLFIYNPNEVNTDNSGVASQNFLTSGYALMKEEELNKEYEYSRYIRNDIETKDYLKLNKLEEKRKFMFDFWKKRDSNLQTPQNEFKIDYFKRISETNKLFKESFKEGYKTDRGRIYVVYGKPDDVTSYPYEPDSKSYQLWHYNAVEGGGDCVFVELHPSTGDYWLVHSSFRSELKNENWKSELNNTR